MVLILSLHLLIKKLTTMYRKPLFIIITGTVLVLSSCKPSGTNTGANQEAVEISKAEIQQGVEKVLFPLPEPMKVYNMLQDIDAGYVGNILNPVQSLDTYKAGNAKAVNLGIYAADLSYATVYDKKNDVDAYSQVLKSMIDDLGVKVDYQMLTSQESRKKVENPDSLAKLTTQVFFDVYDFLNKESDPSYAALMANGYYIEGLYIATHLLKETYNSFEMLKIVCQQEAPLAEIIKLNEKFADNLYIQKIQVSLKSLKAFYESTKGSINQQQLDEIAKQIEAVRKSLV
jgi:hypothetical protein